MADDDTPKSNEDLDQAKREVARANAVRRERERIRSARDEQAREARARELLATLKEVQARLPQEGEAKTAAVGGLAGAPEWPERGLTMPDSDEYFVVAEQRLDTLSERRHNEFYEWMLFAAGIGVGALIPTGVALWGWVFLRKPMDGDGYLNSLLLAGAVAGFFVCRHFWRKDKDGFVNMLNKIKAGKRYGIAPGSNIPLRPTSETDGHNSR